MPYDRLGFPVPHEFESAPARGRQQAGADPRQRFDDGSPPSQPRRGVSAGPLKRWLLLATLALVVVPALVLPTLVPMAREAAVRWFLRSGADAQARGDVHAAAANVGRAIAWLDDHPEVRGRLLCWLSELLLADRQAAAAVAAATRAIQLMPTATMPRQRRAIAHVVNGDAMAALADAEAVVEMAPAGNPEALNHHAYIRAVIGQDLQAALTDIEAALAGGDADTAEYLDTRGFILHLLGRHREAIDDFNQAIGKSRQAYRVAAAGGRDDVEVALRLRAIDQGLAVMHHHRGSACRAIGLDRQAAQDFDVAESKGFDPSRGVF